MKVDRKNFKGIEYVQLAELPQTQQEQFVQNTNPDVFIKILIDDQILSDCIQYKDYSSWFDNVFAKKPVPVKEKVTESIPVTAVLVLKA